MSRLCRVVGIITSIPNVKSITRLEYVCVNERFNTFVRRPCSMLWGKFSCNTCIYIRISKSIAVKATGWSRKYPFDLEVSEIICLAINYHVILK